MFTLSVIVILLLVNGFFVAAEFALVKARPFSIDSLASDGSAAARLTASIQGNLEAYLAACQLGITMASLGLGWVGEPAVAALLEPLFKRIGLPPELLHTVAFVVGFLLFSSLHIVIGEQVPKTFAIRRAEQVSLWVAYPLHWSYVLVWPLNWALNKASGGILAWFNVAEATHGDVFTDSEFKDLVSKSADHGVMESKKAAMLQKLLDFDQRTVARVMIPRHAVDVLDVALPRERNRRVVADSGHSRFPLVNSADEDVLLGVVLAKTLYKAEHDGVPDPWQSLADHCIEPLVVPETQRVAALFDLMREKRVHLAVIVDEYGRFIGIITLEDLLEEIVGEIEDEQDGAHARVWVQSLGDNRWGVDGLCSLYDLEREIGFPEDVAIDANSIAGLILQRLQRMPRAGDSITHDHFVLTVGEMNGQRIGLVEIERVPQLDSPDPDP